LCPRLAAFRAEVRRAEPSWHNAPVPSFGPPDARVLIVGLAPGLRGANRTGRPFTGDFAGDLLYHTLLAHGFAEGSYLADPGDGLQLSGTMITNAVRCVPPANKPTAAEINACRPFLAATIKSLPNLSVIVALGRIAHEQVLRAFGLKPAAFAFAHGAEHALPVREGASLMLFDSYHCSRYNTNTGVLTAQMFHALLANVRASVDALPRVGSTVGLDRRGLRF
jgi:uracil-DNA glycosylase family 4